MIEMGFLDKLRKKSVEPNEKQTQDKAASGEQQPSASSSSSGTGGRRIKKYTSEGKPVYE